MARFAKFFVVSFVLDGYCYTNALDCIPSRNFSNHIISIQKPRHVSTAQQSPLHVQKGIIFLCKIRIKIGCSNYIKMFVSKPCFFKAFKRLLLKIYAKESSLYGAISRVLRFTQVPRAVFAIHTIFCCFRNRYGTKLLVRNIPHTYSVISIDIFLKCDIMLL